jgi:hypothetical protein
MTLGQRHEHSTGDHDLVHDRDEARVSQPTSDQRPTTAPSRTP